MSRWFRHYAGMMRDDKLVRVAIRSKQTIERVAWVWGAILESAAEVDDEGRYDVDAAEVAYFLRADQCDVDAILHALSDAGRIADGRVVKWGNRQFQSDRSKDRVASHRERKRAQGDGNNVTTEAGNGDVTLHGGDGNAPETELEAETEDRTSKDDSPSGDGLSVENVFEAFQSTMSDLGLRTPRDLTPERRQLIRGRIKQYPLDDFLTVFQKCRDSPFLRGDKGRTPLRLDWLMKRGNFQRTLEGAYD